MRRVKPCSPGKQQEESASHTFELRSREPGKMSSASFSSGGCPNQSPGQDAGHLDDPMTGSTQWSLFTYSSQASLFSMASS